VLLSVFHTNPHPTEKDGVNIPQDLTKPAALRFGRFQPWLALSSYLLLFAAFLLPRMGSLGSFVTADEPTWGKRSANFYYALANGEYGDTLQTGHPGVITMWAGAGAYALKFPEYREIGRAWIGDVKLLQDFQKYGINPMDILATGRFLAVMLNILAMMAAYFFARHLLDGGLALVGFLFIAFDPFYVAHTRFLHTNGLLASFMILSLLAYLDYLRSRRIGSLVVSGGAAGLSFLSLTPGYFLAPILGLLTLSGLWETEERRFIIGWQRLLKKVILPYAAWAGIALLVVYLAWPAMWAHPVQTLLDTFRYALSASAGDIGGAQFIEAYTSPAGQELYLYYYPLTYAWRATPVVLAGLALALLAVIIRGKSPFRTYANRALLALLGFALLYGLLMTAGEKKFDRYLLPAYPALDLIAAGGWLGVAGWLAAKSNPNRPALLQPLPLTALLLPLIAVGFQAAATASSAPYYLTYYDPLLGGLSQAPQTMTVGWGEGLNEAAIYLQKVPDIRRKKILSWYPLAFTWYSLNLGLQSQAVEFTPQTSLSEYLGYDYLVIYINQMQRHNPGPLLDYLEGIQPECTIRIGGVEYVRIYNLHPAGAGGGPESSLAP
jgi:4-amino-4-deoxy-L-arabinose transferase-like glycosyltransferase